MGVDGFVVASGFGVESAAVGADFAGELAVALDDVEALESTSGFLFFFGFGSGFAVALVAVPSLELDVSELVASLDSPVPDDASLVPLSSDADPEVPAGFLSVADVPLSALEPPDVDALEVDEPELEVPDVSADATPTPVKTATPIPSATANAPTRPT